MFKLDDNLLIELGLGALPAAEKNRMLGHIYETLEMRVGMKLAQRMTNEQLDEFEAFIDRNDEAGALKWLESNFPNYKQVVADELETLKAEVRNAAPQIVAASQQAAAAMPQAQPIALTSPQQPVANPAAPVGQPYQQPLPQQPPQQQPQQYPQPAQPQYSQPPMPMPPQQPYQPPQQPPQQQPPAKYPPMAA